jgi:hypothetical protein
VMILMLRPATSRMKRVPLRARPMPMSARLLSSS